jgi:hypothetical protein
METQDIQPGTIPPAFESTPTVDFSSYDAYYKEEFTKISESSESYKGKWNWYSFLFSWIWLFTKGAWAMALIILASIIVTYGSVFYLILGIGWAIQCGRRGTWMYYNVKIKNKQMSL